MRLAEPLAALSLVTDLARGRAQDEAIRACVLATRLARQIGLSGTDVGDVYYVTLLRHVGCTATSTEYAAAFGGDDIAVRRDGDAIDPSDTREALGFVLGLGRRADAGTRLGAVSRGLVAGRRVVAEATRGSCEVGRRLAQRFRLGHRVERALFEAFERWDGAGAPMGRAGDRIALAARVANVAFAATMGATSAGVEGAVDVVTRWTGKILDPDIANAFVRRADLLLEGLAGGDAWEAALAAEPEPQRTIGEDEIDELAAGFAEVADLKSTYLLGHSEGVADLAVAAAGTLGRPPEEVRALRRAALVHDIGRAGVPTGVWDRRGPLGIAQWEQVRLHPYHTERILRRSAMLAPLAECAAAHHERLDGRGYHRSLPAALLSVPARVLAAADAFHALTEERPHRPRRSPADAARALEATAAEGTLDRETVAAVIVAAGETAREVRVTWPDGLTDREVEILRLLAVGRSLKEIATELVVSTSTAHTHAAHIYEKTGLSTRAALALFAMEHDLLRR